MSSVKRSDDSLDSNVCRSNNVGLSKNGLRFVVEMGSLFIQ